MLTVSVVYVQINVENVLELSLQSEYRYDNVIAIAES